MKEITSPFKLAVFAELVLAQWLRRSPPATPNDFNQRAKCEAPLANRDRGANL